MAGQRRFGYLLVHFVEDPDGYGERIHLSLSDGDDPRRWVRLHGGAPVLTSSLGTTGVRDPAIVRSPLGFFIVATDLRIYGGDERGWDEWTRTGSRSLIVWHSDDLVTWSPPWSVEVAPPTAGMAWAPEVLYDPDRDDFLVYWSSKLYAEDDPEHRGDSYSRILGARTPDLRSFDEPLVLLDAGDDVIDTVMFEHNGRVHRFSKASSPERKLYHEVGPDLVSDERFEVVATRIADDLFDPVEGPLIFRHNHELRWYLWVDQYQQRPQGYLALTTTDLTSGRWDLVDGFELPPNTKHGGVLPLVDDEWERLAAAYPA